MWVVQTGKWQPMELLEEDFNHPPPAIRHPPNKISCYITQTMSQNALNTSNILKTISTKCGGVGSWLTNTLGNAGPGSGSILSLPPYSASSLPSPSSFSFPGILQRGGGTRSKGGKKTSRKRKGRRTKRRTKH